MVKSQFCLCPPLALIKHAILLLIEFMRLKTSLSVNSMPETKQRSKKFVCICRLGLIFGSRSMHYVLHVLDAVHI